MTCIYTLYKVIYNSHINSFCNNRTPSNPHLRTPSVSPTLVGDGGRGRDRIVTSSIRLSRRVFRPALSTPHPDRVHPDYKGTEGRPTGALDGGPQCRMSILRNDNVACHCRLFPQCHMSNLRKCYFTCHCYVKHLSHVTKHYVACRI